MNPFTRLKDSFFGLRQPNPKLPVIEDQERQPPPLLAPQARPSWQPFVADVGNPWFRVPQDQNLRLYEQLVQTIPVLNRAIECLVQLVGVPCVEADANVKAEIDDWMGRVVANRIQVGFNCWFPSWLGDGLLYGRSHAELVLPQSLDDVYALQSLHPRTIDLRPAGAAAANSTVPNNNNPFVSRRDGYSLDIVQIMAQRGMWVTLNPRLILTYCNDVRTDLPHGHSLFFGLPFVAEIVTSMLKNEKGIWERFGNPCYFLNWVQPKELADPKGTLTQGVVNQATALWNGAMQNRANGDVTDIILGGDWKLQVVGANGEALDFVTPFRELVIQLVAKTGIPAFMLGLHDATTETLSTTQAELLSATINHIRRSVEPQVRYAIQLRQRLAGKSDQFTLSWDAPTLTDLEKTAKAELEQAKAEAQAIVNDHDLWRDGVIDNLEFARRHREDLEGLTDEEVAAKLPNLEAEPPAPTPVAPGFGAGLTPDAVPGGAGGGKSLLESLNGNGRGH